MKMYIGIDPGQEGAWAILDEERNVHDAKKFTSYQDFRDVMQDYTRYEKLATLEKLGAMPVRGSIGNFKVGQSFGAWQGLLTGLNIPFEMITPSVWQRGVLDSKPVGREKVKKAVLDYVLRIYPEVKLPRKKDQDIADAICISLYGVIRDGRFKNKD